MQENYSQRFYTQSLAINLLCHPLSHLQLPMNSTSSQQCGPKSFIRLYLHSKNQLFGFLHLAYPPQHIHHTRIVLQSWFNPKPPLHHLEILPPFVCQTAMTTCCQYCRKSHAIWPLISLQHPIKQPKHFTKHPMHSIPCHHR
ncbi:hypothetical protein RGQ29_001135 [Quercus rubra]|uniref:Uncharacterized protein n=1 Tax=Quercus rubra TaxID=3512 RepID=A0AAN7G545_QUERU|nr:hypothetical protein RGQ29_001135 [Quercus rubra]